MSKELLKLAEYIARDKPLLPDHACSRCVKEFKADDSMILDGFDCAYHLALDIVKEERQENKKTYQKADEVASCKRHKE